MMEYYEPLDLYVHGREQCVGEWCCIHNPSDHHMRGFPLHWRADRGIMERICPHGVGHPDPDDVAFNVIIGADASKYSVHGCDGCCSTTRQKVE